MILGHFFADHGVESEALAGYGDVIRFSIEPNASIHTETVQMDLSEQIPDVSIDLGLFHPPCTVWSTMPGANKDGDAPNLIPRAREIARETCEHWIIENKPGAPLENPTVLNGKQFGLPIEYERAFETSFSVPSPPRQQSLDTETSPFYYSERSLGWWKSVKGVRGNYPKEHVAKNALPLCYVDFLVRAYLDATGDSRTDSDYSEYDSVMETKRRENANRSLSEEWA